LQTSWPQVTVTLPPPDKHHYYHSTLKYFDTLA